jgi:catechol 2,3-dioxygenase
MAVSRFSYASVNVLDVDAAVTHYTNVVGLRLVEKIKNQAYFQAADNQDHHCVVVTKSDVAGLDHVGFKVSAKGDLKEAAKAAKDWGLAVSEIKDGQILGQGPGVRITLPGKLDMVLFFHADKIGYLTGMENPDPVPSQREAGARVTHLDHTLLSCENPGEAARFLAEALDFSLTEKIVDPGGNTIAAFMTCGGTMHDLAIGPGPDGSFHHMAFGVESRGEVIEGVDILKETGTPALEYGITRHGVAGVTTIYFHDPSGNRNEFFNGAYQAAGIPDQIPPIVWPADQFPRGGFYYESKVPASFFDEVT